MKVILVSDGKRWQGWQSLSIQQTLDKAQHSFTMSTTDRFKEGVDRWNISGGSSVDIYFDDSLAFRGYVQKYNVAVTSLNHSIKISGESRAIDAVQSSHDGNYYWRNVSSESVIQEVLEPLGLNFEIDGELTPISNEGFRVAVNSSPFSIVKKLAERNGFLVYTDNDGNFKVSKTSNQLSFTEITTGDWIEITADHDVSKSFSEIIVKGQTNSFDADFDNYQRMEHRVSNAAQKRYRPLIVLATGQQVEQDNLSHYIHRRLTGDSLSVSVKLKTAFDKSGNLWGVGQRVWLNEPIIDVNQELLVSGVSFSLNEASGFETTLTLKIPETYSIDPVNSRIVRRSSGIFENILKAFL